MYESVAGHNSMLLHDDFMIPPYGEIENRGGFT